MHLPIFSYTGCVERGEEGGEVVKFIIAAAHTSQLLQQCQLVSEWCWRLLAYYYKCLRFFE